MSESASISANISRERMKTYQVTALHAQPSTPSMTVRSFSSPTAGLAAGLGSGPDLTSDTKDSRPSQGP
eukprot:425457-Hanusia_phi.AAC.5